MARHGMWAAGGLMVLALAGCASLVGETASEVALRTDPANATCSLRGYRFQMADIQTPATVSVPHTAAPVTVTCRAPGRAPTSFSLDATADGWVWGNGAMAIASGGVAMLGALVDEVRGAGKVYPAETNFTLDPAAPRAVQVRQRDGSQTLDLQAR